MERRDDLRDYRPRKFVILFRRLSVTALQKKERASHWDSRVLIFSRRFAIALQCHSPRWADWRVPWRRVERVAWHGRSPSVRAARHRRGECEYADRGYGCPDGDTSM